MALMNIQTLCTKQSVEQGAGFITRRLCLTLSYIPPSLTFGIIWVPGTDPAQGSWYEKYVIHVCHVCAQEFCFLTVEFFHSCRRWNLISIWCRLVHTARASHYITLFGHVLFNQLGLGALIQDTLAVDMVGWLPTPAHNILSSQESNLPPFHHKSDF